MYAGNRNIRVLHEDSPLVLSRKISRKSCATNLANTLQTAFAGKELLLVVSLAEEQSEAAESILQVLAGTGAHLAFAEEAGRIPAAALARSARAAGAHGLAVGPDAEAFRFGIQQGQYYAAVVFAGCEAFVTAAQTAVTTDGYVAARLKEADDLDRQLKAKGCSGPKPF